MGGSISLHWWSFRSRFVAACPPPPRATARVPTPLHTAPALTMRTKGSLLAADHCKGGGGVERGGDPCGRPDHAPQCWRPFSHVQVFSHCAEQRCLPRSALAIRSLCGFAEMWGIVRRSPCGASPLHAPSGLFNLFGL